MTLRKAFTYEDTGLDVDPASMRAGATIVPKLAPAFMTHTRSCPARSA